MPRITANLTVGLEIECVHMSQTTDFEEAARELGFSRHLDHSIRGANDEVLPRTWPGAGSEIVTRPIVVPLVVNGDGNSLRLNTTQLDAVTRRLCACVGYTNSSCGFHVHLGRPSKADPLKSSWEPDRVRTMLVVGQILEDRLFSLVHPSRQNNYHCERIGRRYSKTDFSQFYPVGRVDPVKYNNQKRYCWLNLIETARVGNRTEAGLGGSPALGTVEIRLLGDTSDTNYILAWTTLWTKIAALVAYAPASLAISHCCFSSTLEPDFLALKAAFEMDSKNRHSVQESVPVSELRPAVSELRPVEMTIQSTPVTDEAIRRRRDRERRGLEPVPAPTSRVRRRSDQLQTSTSNYVVPLVASSTSTSILPSIPMDFNTTSNSQSPPTTPF